MNQIGSWTKKTFLLLLGKVEKNKYSEVETWYPKSRDGWSYYRLFENLTDNTLTWSQGQFTPNLGQKYFFLLNFTRILWLFWELGRALFDIPKGAVFCKNFVLSSIFGFPTVNWALKMDQNCKLWVCSIWTKIQNLEGFFKRCISLIERLPLVKISARTIFGVRAQNPQNGTISLMLNQYEKLWIF